MKKSEIKNGAILKTRNGMCWFKVDNTLLEVDFRVGVGFDYMPWDNYDKDMKYPKNPDYDVVGVDNNVDNEKGYCNHALAKFLHEKTVFEEVNNDPIVTEGVYRILKFLLATTPFEHIAKDNDGTYEVYLYKYEPKKMRDFNAEQSSWYWAPADAENGTVPNVSDLFKSKEADAFFKSLDPNKVYKIGDLVK